MGKLIIRVIVFSTILYSVILPTSLKAEDDAALGYTLTIGVAAKQLDFDYYRPEDDNDPAGSMTEGMYFTYLFRAGSPYNLSENKKWGYYFETGFSKFSMSKQNVGDEEKNLGTSVKGHFWYVTPIGFYLFGPVPSNKKEISLLAGIGIGAGYIDAKGDMILTEYGSNELHKVNHRGFDLAVSILLEAHYGKWMTRIYGGGPFQGIFPLSIGPHFLVHYSPFDKFS
ncbi:MAG: hypothetical protein ACMUJM_21175 [bacterium]